jgi:hypothetical protein
MRDAVISRMGIAREEMRQAGVQCSSGGVAKERGRPWRGVPLRGANSPFQKDAFGLVYVGSDGKWGIEFLLDPAQPGAGLRGIRNCLDIQCCTGSIDERSNCGD